MGIFVQICGVNGDVENNPDIKLTDYTVKEINWITKALDPDKDEDYDNEIEYMIEIKGEINPESAEQEPETAAAKQLIFWALTPPTDPSTYRYIDIEVYAGDELESIKDVTEDNRIRNDAMKEAYVVNYTEKYPDEQYGGRGIFTLLLANKLQNEDKLWQSTEEGTDMPQNSFSDLPVGANSVNWNGAGLPAGSYNLMLKTESSVSTHKFSLKTSP